MLCGSSENCEIVALLVCKTIVHAFAAVFNSAQSAAWYASPVGAKKRAWSVPKKLARSMLKTLFSFNFLILRTSYAKLNERRFLAQLLWRFLARFWRRVLAQILVVLYGLFGHVGWQCFCCISLGYIADSITGQVFRHVLVGVSFGGGCYMLWARVLAHLHDIRLEVCSSFGGRRTSKVKKLDLSFTEGRS